MVSRFSGILFDGDLAIGSQLMIPFTVILHSASEFVSSADGPYQGLE